MEDRGVADYVVHVFHRGIRHGMELMEGMCTADPPHWNTGGACRLREVSVLAAVSAVALTEPADLPPRRRGQGKRQRPEQRVVCGGDHLAGAGRWPCRVRVDQVFEI